MSYQQSLTGCFRPSRSPPTHTNTTLHMCRIKDTGQCIDFALYGFQHAPLGGYVFLGCHSDAKEKEREVAWEMSGKKWQSSMSLFLIGTVKCLWLSVSQHGLKILFLFILILVVLCRHLNLWCLKTHRSILLTIIGLKVIIFTSYMKQMLLVPCARMKCWRWDVIKHIHSTTKGYPIILGSNTLPQLLQPPTSNIFVRCLGFYKDGIELLWYCASLVLKLGP